MRTAQPFLCAWSSLAQHSLDKEDLYKGKSNNRKNPSGLPRQKHTHKAEEQQMNFMP